MLTDRKFDSRRAGVRGLGGEGLIDLCHQLFSPLCVDGTSDSFHLRLTRTLLAGVVAVTRLAQLFTPLPDFGVRFGFASAFGRIAQIRRSATEALGRSAEVYESSTASGLCLSVHRFLPISLCLSVATGAALELLLEQTGKDTHRLSPFLCRTSDSDFFPDIIHAVAPAGRRGGQPTVLLVMSPTV